MKYKYEQIEKEYIPKQINQKECFALCKEKVFHPTRAVERSSLSKQEKSFEKTIPLEKSSLQKKEKNFHRNQAFDWEMFQWADYEFVNWANSMPETMLMAVMAELKHAPKMKPEIESLRQKVKEVPFCSIEEYRKKKRLGERSVDFLKKMKLKYGKTLLRLLYLS